MNKFYKGYDSIEASDVFFLAYSSQPGYHMVAEHAAAPEKV